MALEHDALRQLVSVDGATLENHLLAHLMATLANHLHWPPIYTGQPFSGPGPTIQGPNHSMAQLLNGATLPLKLTPRR